jgi:hypothetical protein
MNASHRIAARIAAVLAPIVLAGALPAAAPASDWGCQVLLCLSNPGSPTEYSACVPPIEKLYSVLATGGGFPSCTEGGMSTSKMGMQLYQCPAGWSLKPSRSPFGGNICQSLTETHQVCTDGSSGHDDSSQTECHDEPVERAADRNPKPNYIDVTYPDGQGGTTVQRVWFSLKD